MHSSEQLVFVTGRAQDAHWHQSLVAATAGAPIMTHPAYGSDDGPNHSDKDYDCREEHADRHFTVVVSAVQARGVTWQYDVGPN